ncbi:hypothetical protein [Rugamonas sp.]|uniref:hypothetical protein n=1 Tax=Rugamonas sp. TaxID=1926287 RepID=UPI0025EA292B|nr:hypothetical protein [Rugamonas sp.]
MTEPAIAPANADDLEALADSLSACADELHTRLMRAIRQRATTPTPAPSPPGPGDAAAASIDHGISQGAAQALFENEVALRQRANGLYLDAAALAVGGLRGMQRQLLDVTAQARETLRQVERLKDMIGITSELLALGAAIASGKVEHLATPYNQLKRLVDDLRRQNAAAPPSA